MKQSILAILKESVANQNIDVLVGILNLIKQTMIHTLTEEQFQEFVYLRDLIPKEHQALYIETLVEYPFFIVEEVVLDEYIQLISMQCACEEDAVRCLDNMSSLGIEEELIFKKVVDMLNEEQALIILAKSTICSEKAPDGYLNIYEKVKKRRNIHKRSFLVSSFLLIVHPFLDKYIEISAIKFAYSSAESAIMDKAWYYAEDSETLIQEKILNSNEVEILKELGREFERNHTLNLEKANELYYSFFLDSSPIDVMFMLPD